MPRQQLAIPKPKAPRGQRHQHKDVAATYARHFRCGRSFIALDGREFLAGGDWLERKLKVWQRDNGKCQCPALRILGITTAEKTICGKPAQDVHHILKRSKGGDESFTNLACLCRLHHNSMHPEKQTRFGKEHHVAKRGN